MATKVKPIRLNITGTPQVGNVPTYVDANTFAWGAGGGGGASFGRFLSLWDSTTGMPISFPEATPYTYLTGDYFIVETVSSATPPVNYRPTGSSYTGTASSVTESDEVEVGDTYVYDGTTWLLQSNHGKTVTFANIAGDPYDNANLDSALDAKQDVLVSGTNIKTVNNNSLLGSGNVSVGDMKYTDYNWTTLTGNSVTLALNSQITPAANFTINAPGTIKDGQEYILRVTSGGTVYAITLGTNMSNPSSVDTTLTANSVDQFVFLAVGGQLELQPRDKDTTYTASTGISINGSNQISNTGVLSFNGSTGAITYTAPVTSVNGSTGAVTVNDVKVSSTAPSSPTEGMTWYDTTNDQLKVYDGTNWNITGKEYNAGPGISIGTYNDYSAKQGPCSEGFHVPTKDEFQQLLTAYNTLTNSLGANGIRTYLKMPYNRCRRYDSGDPAGVNGEYWTCTHSADSDKAYNFYMPESGTASIEENGTTRGYGIRPFKDTPVTPDGTWTLLLPEPLPYDYGIYHNSTLGLISIVYTGGIITISDKNLGATTVYNTGDALSEDNCGKFYQWGNNYGFAWTGAITTSSSQTSASSYGPSEYSSSIFIIQNSTPSSWDSSDNNNLWGGEIGVVTNAIINTGVLSVNGQTGNVTVAGGIQNDTTGTTTTVTKIRAGTEAEYALITPDANTIYHIY